MTLFNNEYITYRYVVLYLSLVGAFFCGEHSVNDLSAAVNISGVTHSIASQLSTIDKMSMAKTHSVIIIKCLMFPRWREGFTYVLLEPECGTHTYTHTLRLLVPLQKK